MKKAILAPIGLLVCCSLLFTACKKVSSAKDALENAGESQIQADDQSVFALGLDEGTTDASTVVENVFIVTGASLLNNFPPPCNADIAYDTLNAVRTVTITYHGDNCIGTRTRTGTVSVSIPAGVQWKNAGAQLMFTYSNFKITRKADNKSVIVNGKTTLTNVTGGLLHNLSTVGTITHTITAANMSLTFDDGTQRIWQVAKQRVFTYNNGMVITITGTHTDGTTTGICEWGTNRLGNDFVTQIIDPLIIRQDCAYRLTSGRIKHSKLIRSVDVTFGLDAAGLPTSCPGAGFYYMKVTWVGALGNTNTVLLPY